MWLINTRTYELCNFVDERHVSYAILSHRWQDKEVLFEDLDPRRGNPAIPVPKAGWRKIELCCQQALQDNLDFAWVDTCCINKESSAELQEAINSMYRWYASAKVCYAYLSDVASPVDRRGSDSFRRSEWFERGWTLQELLAPSYLIFYDRDWCELGDRVKNLSLIREITGIGASFLEEGYQNMVKPCIAVVMSWARGRKTARLEDRAYSLMGLFDINMPMLYGEGEKAFIRLQEAILSRSEDQSIFAWEGVSDESVEFLAPSPDFFPARPPPYRSLLSSKRLSPHMLTNQGIQIQVQLKPLWPQLYLAILNSRIEGGKSMGIYIKRIDEDGRYARIGSRQEERLDSDLAIIENWSGEIQTITLVSSLRIGEKFMYSIEYQTIMCIRACDDEWHSWISAPNLNLKITDWKQYDLVPSTRWKDFFVERGYGLLGSFDLAPATSRPGSHLILCLGYDAHFNPVGIVTTYCFEPWSDRSVEDFLCSKLYTSENHSNLELSAVIERGAKSTLLKPGMLALRLDHVQVDSRIDVNARVVVDSWLTGYLELSFRSDERRYAWMVSFKKYFDTKLEKPVAISNHLPDLSRV